MHYILSRVKGVILYQTELIKDPRGNLVAYELERLIPFTPKRFFLIHEVPSEKLRGEHAHKKCHQFAICLQGSCKFRVDDGQEREEFDLDGPSKGLYIPPVIWATHFRYTQSALLAVFASHKYQESDYIRDPEGYKYFMRKGSQIL